MKKKILFIIEVIIGIIFVFIGFLIIDTAYYSTLFSVIGFSFIFTASMQLLKLYYYQMPTNKEKYEYIQKEAHINSIDERKIFLRMKAASFVYEIMTFVFLFVAFFLALLQVKAWVIGMIFGLFLLQTILGFISYKHFEKNM